MQSKWDKHGKYGFSVIDEVNQDIKIPAILQSKQIWLLFLKVFPACFWYINILLLLILGTTGQ